MQLTPPPRVFLTYLPVTPSPLLGPLVGGREGAQVPYIPLRCLVGGAGGVAFILFIC